MDDKNQPVTGLDRKGRPMSGSRGLAFICEECVQSIRAVGWHVVRYCESCKSDTLHTHAPSAERKPSAKWSRDGRFSPDDPVVTKLDMEFGALTLRGYADDYGGNWSVEVRNAAGAELKAAGGSFGSGDCAALLEAAQLAAEDALRKLLTDALKELG